MRWAGLVSSIALGAFAFAPASGHAGGRPYAFTQGTETLPETGLEIETWLGADRPRASTTGPTWDWWIGPTLGLTDQLEVSLFTIFVQPANGPNGGSLSLSSSRLYVSYLLAPRGEWFADVRVRGEFDLPVGKNKDDPRPLPFLALLPTVWLSVLASTELGPVNVTVNLGTYMELERSTLSPAAHYSVAAAVDVLEGLKLGVETFGEGKIDQTRPFQFFAGPVLGYGHGRLWLATTLGFGLSDRSSQQRGRMVVGIAF